MADGSVVLSVEDISITYTTQRGIVQAVSNVSFDLHAGETLALIGESGCGKSTIVLGLIGLLPKTGKITTGKVTYRRRDGRLIDVLGLNKEQMRQFLWNECSMVFQGALNSLNPVLKISSMIYDTARAHGMRADEAKKRALSLFEKVRLDPLRVFNSYPHELSGGMRQRVLLATALLLRPQVVIMDEPTTAVDILTQRSIIKVLKQLREELNFSVIFISHDLAVAAEIADTVATMYAGEIIEKGPVSEVFYRPRHAYTLGLLEAAPRLSTGAEELMSIPGSPPDLIDPPKGCKFHMRCRFVTDECKTTKPPLQASSPT
ncbi:MAG: putative ABC transporter ATP-binding protein [Chloroflexi bacterium OLB13]|nr:MAG: putative ABC transporter ATP-binding protein [Chloroflexi bacterium OLB13]